MFIDLANVTATRKKLKAKFASNEIDLDGGDVWLAGPAEFRGEAQLLAGKVHIRGIVAADVETNCSRCLEPVTRRVEAAFDDVFVDSKEETTAGEMQVADADLDEQLVIGGKVDLVDVIREQILLAMPEQIYCRENCLGLCPKCGENRNLIDCNCADDDIDPRWAALKNLN
jgi:uncharacterized protein